MCKSMQPHPETNTSGRLGKPSPEAELASAGKVKVISGLDVQVEFTVGKVHKSSPAAQRHDRRAARKVWLVMLMLSTAVFMPSSPGKGGEGGGEAGSEGGSFAFEPEVPASAGLADSPQPNRAEICPSQSSAGAALFCCANSVLRASGGFAFRRAEAAL